MKIGSNAQANFYYSQAVDLERRTQGHDAAMVNYMKAEVFFFFFFEFLLFMMFFFFFLKFFTHPRYHHKNSELTHNC